MEFFGCFYGSHKRTVTCRRSNDTNKAATPIATASMPSKTRAEDELQKSYNKPACGQIPARLACHGQLPQAGTEGSRRITPWGAAITKGCSWGPGRLKTETRPIMTIAQGVGGRWGCCWGPVGG